MRWSYIGSGGAVTGQFISTWKTDNAGTSASDQITLPLINGKSYNMTVDWGDETTNTITAWNQAEATHTYSVSGTYTVTITGTCGGIKFNGGGDKLKILTVTQWGCLNLSTDAVFYGCANLQITAKDTALRTTTTLNDMFRGCSSLAGGVASIGTTGVTSVSRCFQDCILFNGDLSSWDASSFVSLLSMFDGCATFNQPLDSWNVENVTSIQKAFLNCTAFNQPLNSWDVSSVTRFTDAFSGCTAFNQPLNSWNVSAGTFGGNAMFSNCASFDQDLSSWNITSWANVGNMFFGCRLSAANYDAILIAWAALDVTNSLAFHAGSSKYSSGAAAAARQSLIDDDLWTITDGGLNDFIILLEGVSQFSLPLVSTGSYNMTVDWGDASSDAITAWNQAEATHTYSVSGTYTVTITGTCSGWSFYDNSISANFIFGISNFGPLKIQGDSAFYNCSNLDISATDYPEIDTTTLQNTFFGCVSLTGIGGQWATPSVQNFQSFLSGCASFNQSLDYLNVSSMTNGAQFFKNCTTFNQPLDSWNVAALETAQQMFSGCSAFNGDISSWNPSSLVNASSMFSGCSAFNVDISSWTLPSIETIEGMFVNATSFNQPIGSWDISNLWAVGFGSARSFLSGATSFDQDLSGLDISGAQQLYNFLTNCGISVANYNNTLIGFAAQNVSTFVNFGSPPVSPTGLGLAAKNDLINNAYWIFS
jgi:trimeric autotransporter adhesin